MGYNFITPNKLKESCGFPMDMPHHRPRPLRGYPGHQESDAQGIDAVTADVWPSVPS